MSNQTIDGVPRHWAEIEAAIWGAFADGDKDYRGCTRERLRELRALLDAESAPCAKSQVEGKRERFQKWVMATKHPVYGFLDGRSLARGDDRTGYADEYVQGLWVAYLAFGAEQPAPVAPTPINYGALDPVERLAVCRGEQVRMCDCNQGRFPCNGKCKP